MIYFLEEWGEGGYIVFVLFFYKRELQTHRSFLKQKNKKGEVKICVRLTLTFFLTTKVSKSLFSYVVSDPGTLQ